MAKSHKRLVFVFFKYFNKEEKYFVDETSEFQLCPFGTERPECTSEMDKMRENI